MNTEVKERMHVEIKTRKGTIAIRPYVDPLVPNMGLEKYGMVLHEGGSYGEYLTCLEINGVKRYLTGLNEFAPEVQKIDDKKKREAVIKEIRNKVIFLEKALATNVIEVDDSNFWDKVQVVRPDNSIFWDKVQILMGNDPVFLDPTNPHDLIKLCGIEAGGFSTIAKSLEENRNMNTPRKFYLDKYEETASTRTEIKKIRNNAIRMLQELFDSNQSKLFYVAKVVDGNSAQYKRGTPNDVIYDNMDNFIHGKGVESSLKRAPQSFIDACNMSMEDLKLKAVVRDASFYNYIVVRGDGMLYHHITSSMLGRNTQEAVEYLKSPANDKIIAHLLKQVEEQWKD